MAAFHDEAPGGRQRHMSVSNYATNVEAGSGAYADTGRRRSSIAPAGSFSMGGAPQQNPNVFNQKDDTFRRMSVAVPNLAELTSDAKAGAEAERTMSFREGCRLYPKGMFFSFGLSLAVIMEGYDTLAFGRLLGHASLRKEVW